MPAAAFATSATVGAALPASVRFSRAAVMMLRTTLRNFARPALSTARCALGVLRARVRHVCAARFVSAACDCVQRAAHRISSSKAVTSWCARPPAFKGPHVLEAFQHI